MRISIVESRLRRWFTPLVVVVSVLWTWIFALRPGQDANWDQLNYHLGVPALLLRGGFWDSVVPTGFQSYLNPLILIPQFLVLTHLSPVAATLALATPQALTFVAAGLICRELTGEAVLPALAGFLLCLLSPIALSETGTTFVDLITAVPVLFGLLLLLRRRRTALAGLLLGAAFGFKLTNAIYLFGVPGFFLIGEHRVRPFLLCCAGIGLGFLSIAGWWHLELWERFANPVFPLANTIFHSPDFPAKSMHDDRFLPHSAWGIVRYPIYWMFGGSPTPGLLSPSAEVDPRDARFLFVVLGIAATAVAAALSPRFRRRCHTEPAFGLIAAWACVYLVWLFAFGIHRYMVGLEILTGAVLLALMIQIGRGRGWALAASCLACVIVLHVPRWQRVPFGAHWHAIEPQPIAIAPNALVFLPDVPTGFVIASLPEGTRFIGMSSDFDLSANQPTSLVRHIHSLLAEGRPPFLLALLRSPVDLSAALAGYGLTPEPDCPTVTIGGEAFRLCRLIKVQGTP